MRKNITLLFAALALSACGSAVQVASSGQQFQDGIYYRTEASPSEVAMASSSDVDALVEETKVSEVRTIRSSSPKTCPLHTSSTEKQEPPQ